MGLFDRVERRLERAVNGAFARAFKSEVQPVEIASAIRRAMDDRAAVLGAGRTIVPNLFTVELSDTDYDRLGGYDEELENELIAAAQEHAESQRYQPGGPIQVGRSPVKPGARERLAILDCNLRQTFEQPVDQVPAPRCISHRGCG